jgi:predicted site-specific integrase-resolvase
MPVCLVIIDSVMRRIASLLNMNRKLFVEFLDPEIVVQCKAVGTLDDYRRAPFPFGRLTWEARSDVQHDVAASPHKAIHFAGCR